MSEPRPYLISPSTDEVIIRAMFGGTCLASLKTGSAEFYSPDRKSIPGCSFKRFKRECHDRGFMITEHHHPLHIL